MSYRSHRHHSYKAMDEIIAELESGNKFNILNQTQIDDHIVNLFLEIKLMRFYTSSMILSMTLVNNGDFKTEIFVDVFSPARDGVSSDFGSMNKAWDELRQVF